MRRLASSSAPLPSELDLAHVADVEEAGGGADGLVLLE